MCCAVVYLSLRRPVAFDTASSLEAHHYGGGRGWRAEVIDHEHAPHFAKIIDRSSATMSGIAVHARCCMYILYTQMVLL